MINVLYEDQHMIVVEKPIGMESQSVHSFEPDMVSEIKKHINTLSPTKNEPYVAVIHRLDKPVSGVMVYAKTKKSAAALSKQVQEGAMKKYYQAVACGKLVDIVGNYVDYMLKETKGNCSHIVDKSTAGAKRAELNYRVLGTIEDAGKPLSLVEIELLTGRHHQIRVQLAAHNTPLWGDNRYNPEFTDSQNRRRVNVALCACKLAFSHPISGKYIEFSMEPAGDIFQMFKNI